MYIYELKDKLEEVEFDTNKVQILIFNEKGEEVFKDIKINKSSVSQDALIFDISDEISEILIKHEFSIFQRCLNNVPKEKQTKETVEFLSNIFDYKN